MKPRIVVFEGIDRSGKTTVREEFRKLTDEKYVTVARFLLSNVAYDVIFDRPRQSSALNMVIMERMEESCGLFTIFLDTLPMVCAGRTGCQYTQADLLLHRRVFLDLFGPGSYYRSVQITDGLTPEEIAGNCEEWVASHE